MKKPESYEEWIALAREHQVDTSDAEYGFQTRVMARIGGMKDSYGQGGVVEILNKWLWGSAIGATPVVAGLAIFVFLINGLSVPSGMGNFLGILIDLIPTV